MEAASPCENETASQPRRQQPNLQHKNLRLFSRDKNEFTMTAYSLQKLHKFLLEANSPAAFSLPAHVHL